MSKRRLLKLSVNHIMDFANGTIVAGSRSGVYVTRGRNCGVRVRHASSVILARATCADYYEGISNISSPYPVERPRLRRFRARD